MKNITFEGISTLQRLHLCWQIRKQIGKIHQPIIDLTKRGKLHPIKTSEKSTLYLKSEVLKRNWQ